MQPPGFGGPPPGWYPDPSGEKAWRWWDGSRWTEHASNPSSSLGPYGYGSEPGPASFGHQGVVVDPGTLEYFAAEQRSAPWGKRAFAAYVAVVTLMLIGAWAQRSHLRDIFHTLRVEIDTGVRQPTDQTAGFSGITSLALVLDVPFYVFMLVWQYRAARAARFLGLAATHSPGLGAGAWFIPVVNFWFPYQALRDCLPPDSPGRRTVVRLWAFFVVLVVLNPVCTVLAVVASPAAFLVGAVISVTAGVGFSLSGIRLVQQVTDAHRQLITPSSHRSDLPSA